MPYAWQGDVCGRESPGEDLTGGRKHFRGSICCFLGQEFLCQLRRVRVPPRHTTALGRCPLTWFCRRACPRLGHFRDSSACFSPLPSFSWSFLLKTPFFLVAKEAFNMVSRHQHSGVVQVLSAPPQVDQ